MKINTIKYTIIVTNWIIKLLTARLRPSYVSDSIAESLRELSRIKTVCNAGDHCRCWQKADWYWWLLFPSMPCDYNSWVPTSLDHSQSLVPKLLNVFCCWSCCTMLVVRQIVVKEKRNFCWRWFSLVVELGILRMLIIVLIVEVGRILLLM